MTEGRHRDDHGSLLRTHVRIICRPKSCSASEIIVRSAMVVCVHVVCCCLVEESKRKLCVKIWEISSSFGKALAKNCSGLSDDFNEERQRLASHSVWTIDWNKWRRSIQVKHFERVNWPSLHLGRDTFHWIQLECEDTREDLWSSRHISHPKNSYRKQRDRSVQSGESRWLTAGLTGRICPIERQSRWQ